MPSTFPIFSATIAALPPSPISPTITKINNIPLKSIAGSRRQSVSKSSAMKRRRPSTSKSPKKSPSKGKKTAVRRTNHQHGPKQQDVSFSNPFFSFPPMAMNAQPLVCFGPCCVGAGFFNNMNQSSDLAPLPMVPQQIPNISGSVSSLVEPVPLDLDLNLARAFDEVVLLDDDWVSDWIKESNLMFPEISV